MNKRSLFLGFPALVLVSCLSAGTVSATAVVVPNSLGTVEANFGSAFPFGLPVVSGSMRYQQVFQSSEFSAFGGPTLITQIAFRPDASGSAFSTTIPLIQIDLSSTSAAPDTLSTTFANNVGANDTIVYSGSLSLSSAFTGPAIGPKDFDIIINLTTPFLYNPAAGNLLLDVRNFSDDTSTGFLIFDAYFQVSSSFSNSRVYSNLDLGGVGALTGYLGSINGVDIGLVAQFTGNPAPVPEPSTMLLLGSGLAGLVGIGRRRFKK